MRGNYRILLKTQMMRVCNPALFSRRQDPRRFSRTIGMLLAVVILGGCLMFYSGMIAKGFIFLGQGQAIPRVAVSMASAFVLIFTFLKSNGALFGGKDFDQVMALPVTGFQAAGVKFTFLYLMEMLVCVIVCIPALVVYGLHFSSGPYEILCMILMLLLTPVLPAVAALLVGTVVLTLTSRLPFRQFFSIVFNVGILVGVLAVTFGMGEQSPEELGQMGADLASLTSGVYPLASWAAAPLEGKSPLLLGAFGLLSLGCLFLFLAIVGKYYIPVNSMMASFKIGKKKKAKLGKSSSVFMALYKKEWKRLLSCTIYAVNAVCGQIMMLMAGIAVLFVGEDTFSAMFGIPGTLDMVRKAVPLVFAFLGGMTSTTAPSLSLEGKSRWILCSIPVEPMTIFFSKIALHLSISLPCILISGTCVWIRFEMSLAEGLWMLFVAASYSVFAAFFGMYANVKFPRYDWETEQQAVKNSMSVMVSVFGGMILGMTPFILSIVFLRHAMLITGIFTAAALLISFACYWRLKKVKLFE